MTFETFTKLAESYTAIPVSRRILADIITPVSLFLSIRQGADLPFLFESVEGGERLARYSFLGKNPYQTLRFDGSSVTLQKQNDEPILLAESYFDALERLTTQHTEPVLQELPRLTGGAVGFSSYDTVREVEDLPNTPENDVDLPEAIWSFYDEVFAFDHVKQQVVLMKTVFVDESTDLQASYRSAEQALDTMEETATSARPSYQVPVPLICKTLEDR